MSSLILDHPTISVVVPVYNTDSYLRGCIHSILEQSIGDIELILVDDGSSDGSGAIIDEEARHDNRIKILHKTNAGQQAAVADGVRMTKGEWITFVDSDDTLPVDALKTLLDNTSDGTDIVVGFSFLGDGTIVQVPIKDWRIKMLRSDVILCTRWGKLYRRTLFNDDVCYVPSDVRVGEDMVMNIKQAFFSTLPVTVVNSKVYNYNRHEGSVSSSWVWNLERHDRLYLSVKQAIPQKELSKEYMFAVIQNGLHTLQMAIWKGSETDKHNLQDSALHKHVKDDVEAWGYKPRKQEERMLLYHPSSSYTYLIVAFGKAILFIRQYISRNILKKG